MTSSAGFIKVWCLSVEVKSGLVSLSEKMYGERLGEHFFGWVKRAYG